MEECRSFGSNDRCRSQTRKLSVGVLVNSMANTDSAKKRIKEVVMLTAENGTSGNVNSVGDHEKHSPPVEKHYSHKDASPWISTRSFNRKMSSSVAIHDMEHNPSLHRKTHPRSELLKKASAAHSVKFFPGNQFELDCEQGSQKNLSKASLSKETGLKSNPEKMENAESLAQLQVEAKEPVKDQNAGTESKGCETLRIKLWEILENVSSPNQHYTGPQAVDLHPNAERDRKNSPNEKTIPNSDTIESDSERPEQNLKRPLTRSLTRNKASNKKIEAKKSTNRKKECPQKALFPSRENCSGTLFRTVSDGSLRFKKSKISGDSNGVETYQGHMYENVQVMPPLEKRNESDIPKMKDPHENIAKSLSNNKRNSVNDPFSLTFDAKPPIETSSPCFPESIQTKLHAQSPPESTFHTKGIPSFDGLLSSKSTKRMQHTQDELSDSGEERDNSPLVQPSSIMEEDKENGISRSIAVTTDSESSSDDSHAEGCRETEPLSPEHGTAEELLYAPNKRLNEERRMEMAECTPRSESLTGMKDSSELHIYLQQNQEDDFASAVALFIVAIGRFKTNLNSITGKKSAEILEAAAEQIVLQLQNVESQIRSDLVKLTNFSKSKRKRLENGFKEQQDQLLGIYRRFKGEVDQQLQAYDSLMEDLEEHEIELKGTVERQRATQRKLIAHVEQAINIQLDDAERRTMAIQELAREKMLQLKLVVSECVRHGALG